ncbi:MAG: TrkH family potassium uptake protein [Coraliomargaritaceae bacterium]
MLGKVLLVLAGAFSLCILVGLLNGEALFENRSCQAFLICVVVSLLLSGLFHYLGRNSRDRMFRREALCLIGLSWLLATFIGAIPYLLIVEDCSFSDAVFECSSGLTTTGATAFNHFHEFPASLLFWRSLSQWMGGLGVVVFFVALLSSLGAGAKILFSSESSGSAADFDQGRIQHGAVILMLYYLAISSVCAIAYKLAGMTWFQAVNHSMTTIATGGFSTEAESIKHFQSPLIEWIAILFMALSATTFLFVIRVFSRRWHLLRNGQEVYWFYAILLGSTLLLTIYLVELTGQLPTADSLRTALFQAVSIMTTTGYASTDFETWLPPAKMLLITLMFIGGCSGSTAGGVKVIRILIAMRGSLRSVAHAMRPNLTLSMRMGGKPLRESAVQNVVIFLMLMIVLQILSMLFVSANEPELTFLSTFSCVQATLFNIGPGFDQVGPYDNFHFLRGSTKLYLSLLMTLGRLELYAVLVLFTPMAWRKF